MRRFMEEVMSELKRCLEKKRGKDLLGEGNNI